MKKNKWKCEQCCLDRLGHAKSGPSNRPPEAWVPEGASLKFWWEMNRHQASGHPWRGLRAGRHARETPIHTNTTSASDARSPTQAQIWQEFLPRDKSRHSLQAESPTVYNNFQNHLRPKTFPQSVVWLKGHKCPARPTLPGPRGRVPTWIWAVGREQHHQALWDKPPPEPVTWGPPQLRQEHSAQCNQCGGHVSFT